MKASLVQLEEAGDLSLNDDLFDRVMGYENIGVERSIQKNLGLGPEQAAELFSDVKKFLLLVACKPRARFGPPARIDAGWHEFLLHTQDYAAFCMTHFGQFIHHLPDTSARFVRQDKMMGSTLAAARSFLGSLSSNWGGDTSMRTAGAGGDTDAGDAPGCKTVVSSESSCVGGSCSSDCTPCSGTTNCQSVTH